MSITTKHHRKDEETEMYSMKEMPKTVQVLGEIVRPNKEFLFARGSMYPACTSLGSVILSGGPDNPKGIPQLGNLPAGAYMVTRIEERSGDIPGYQDIYLTYIHDLYLPRRESQSNPGPRIPILTGWISLIKTRMR